MKIRAQITAAYNQKNYTAKTVYSVMDCFVDSALDTDTDTWQITLGDANNTLVPLLHRDTEVRCNFHVEGDGVFEALHTGIADEISWSDEGVMVINGRDMTCVAVDSRHPPQRFKAARPHVIVANEARALKIGGSLKLAPTNPFQQLATDGSESYWQFWYRLYRKRSMWMWCEPDGTLVGSTLNYNQPPSYYFGSKAGLSNAYNRFNFIPVESVEWRANKQQRVYEAYVIGNRGDKAAFVQKQTDPTMKLWVRKPLVIVNSTSAHGPGEARGEALNELFESKVGATEITVVIANPKAIIRQDRMCFLNVPECGVRGEFYVVGTRIMANPDQGFFQQVRLREKNYAITKRKPKDPALLQGPTDTAMFGPAVDGLGPRNTAGTISLSISQTIGKNWGEYFVAAADAHRGPWPFALFLGTLISIARHETTFRNIRYNGMGGPDYPGTEDGHIPSIVTENKAYNLFVSRYANEPKYGRIGPPAGFDQWAVGPMQLYTPSYKEYADKAAPGGIVDELIGGRWQPRWNIYAGAYALRSKLSGLEKALDPSNAAQAYSLIWQGVTAYGASVGYMREIKALYDTEYAPAVEVAVEEARALNQQGATAVIPQGSKNELINQMLKNQNITYASSAPRDDVKRGIVDETLMKALLAFANAGFDFYVTVFKTGHSMKSRRGSVSRHYTGHAADLGSYRAGDNRHVKAQTWWVTNAKALGIHQVIGPDDYLCYDWSGKTGKEAAQFFAADLPGHDDHIHIGT